MYSTANQHVLEILLINCYFIFQFEIKTPKLW